MQITEYVEERQRIVRHVGSTHSEAELGIRAEPVLHRGEHAASWRAVWAYSAKRAARDGRTLTAQ